MEKIQRNGKTNRLVITKSLIWLLVERFDSGKIKTLFNTKAQIMPIKYAIATAVSKLVHKFMITLDIQLTAAENPPTSKNFRNCLLKKIFNIMNHYFFEESYFSVLLNSKNSLNRNLFFRNYVINYFFPIINRFRNTSILRVVIGGVSSP